MNKSVLLAIAVVIGLGVWMASGMQEEAPEQVVTEPAAEEKPLMKVKVQDSDAARVQQVVKVQGQVEANRTLEVKVEIDGRVSGLPVDEGQRLAAGDNLIEISADYRSAQLAEAKALLKQRRSDLAASIKLKSVVCSPRIG
ncbi:biotin/lipoyl-binding protein [Aliamphritea spongicola]|nr:biotin/lipoyl-binding protein [Aliamphritea spongicola]